MKRRTMKKKIETLRKREKKIEIAWYNWVLEIPE